VEGWKLAIRAEVGWEEGRRSFSSNMIGVAVNFVKISEARGDSLFMKRTISVVEEGAWARRVAINTTS